MLIITHNKQAHADDFLAASFLTYKTDLPIFRKSWPTSEDLEGENWVIDFGQRLEPEKKNFDHHQIKGGAVCAFTQVLEHFGMRDYAALPWIKYIETNDHCGPKEAMRLVGGGDNNLITSASERALIDKFSTFEGLVPEDFRLVMKEVGKWIQVQYNNYSRGMGELNKNAQIHEYRGWIVADYTKCEFIESFSAMGDWEKARKVDLVYSINQRTDAQWRMIRRDEDLDFSYAKDLLGVEFVHQSGFLITFNGDWKKILDVLYFFEGINIYGSEHFSEIMKENGLDKMLKEGETEELVKWADYLFEVFRYKVVRYIKND